MKNSRYYILFILIIIFYISGCDPQENNERIIEISKNNETKIILKNEGVENNATNIYSGKTTNATSDFLNIESVSYLYDKNIRKIYNEMGIESDIECYILLTNINEVIETAIEMIAKDVENTIFLMLSSLELVDINELNVEFGECFADFSGMFVQKTENRNKH